MIGEQKTKDDGYVTIATKVPAHIAELLSILARQRGMEVYELLQLLVNGFITAAKADGPLSPQLKAMIEAIQVDSSWQNAFSFAGVSGTTDIEQMVLVLRQRDLHGHPKLGFGLAMIEHPFCGGTTMTLCIDDILERIVEVSMKGLYKQLRQIGVSFESDSIRETLTMLCDAQTIVNLEEQDRLELPGYGDYHEHGKRVEYGKRTKRIHHKTPDDIAQQQTIIFDDIDRETAQAEVEDWEGEHRQHDDAPEDMEDKMGFRPIGGDW